MAAGARAGARTGQMMLLTVTVGGLFLLGIAYSKQMLYNMNT
jgi:hypothetical protein